VTEQYAIIVPPITASYGKNLKNYLLSTGFMENFLHFSSLLSVFNYSNNIRGGGNFNKYKYGAHETLTDVRTQATAHPFTDTAFKIL
jgi:hypothetical protein